MTALEHQAVKRKRHPGAGRRRTRGRPKGRQVEPAAQGEIAQLLADRPRRRDLLIEYLHLIQDRYHCLSAPHLAALAEEMRIPMAEVYETATFYAHFDVMAEGEAPPPPITVRVCESLTCELMGAQTLLDELEGQPDARVRIMRAPCMGRCAAAPVAEVGHHHVDHADAASVKAAVDEGHLHPELPAYRDFEHYRQDGGYALLQSCLSGERTPEQLIELLGDSGLRGLGGAGFPTGRKWGFVRGYPGPRLMAVNADEGEVGTFKDRYYLEQDPHRVLEGMLIAAWAVEAEAVYFYLRDEYPAVRRILLDELPKLEAAGLAPHTRVHLRRGAGAYICGEESSMIESIEGKRGLPRHRPPYVAEVGIFGRPTLVQNVETLYWIRDIADKGPDWFSAQGRNGGKGLRSYSVSGRVREPGVKLAPAGITALELIEEFCGGMAEGHAFKGYLPGGASGGILPASMGNLPLEFGQLEAHGCFVGSHAVVILGDKDNMKDVALNLMRFFEDESCGQCTPCRNGTEKAVKLMSQPAWDEPLLVELGEVMTDASICGLGQAAANPLNCALKYFREDLLMTDRIRFTLDGVEVEALADETIWQVARRAGTTIPHLCYADEPGYRADGNCRACMVEIEGERVLAASCIRKPAPGMKVTTDSRRASRSRALVMELLVADQPAPDVAPDAGSKFWNWARAMDVEVSRFPARAPLAHDASHTAMRVNLNACINCNLCVRACREVQVNDVIGMAYRSNGAKVVFDFDDPMGDSTCVACGECVQACPTGALMEASLVDEAGVGKSAQLDEVDSVCPYCGVGCQITYQTQNDRIIAVQGRNGPGNEQRLCVKGRFGFDYVRHPHRLNKPLIRRDDAPKGADVEVDPANPLTHFREASWAEALERAASGLAAIRDREGGSALAGFGSAKGSNEEAYLVQKLVRQGFGTNNVDHCTRLCHASSVAALLEGIGSGAVTAPFTAVRDTEVLIVTGANPTENHPVAATFFKQAAKEGKTLIVMDPRGQALRKHATHMLQFQPGTDVALLNAMLNVIVSEGLTDQQYVEANTEGFEALREHIMAFTPEEMAPICGIPADEIREVARAYANAERSIIFWGMGISQHTHGTDNARCLIALAMITGHVGRPGTGLHPLRGQNNVQGASDAGLIPMVFPDYQSVESDDIRSRFEDLWGRTLDSERGLTVVEIMDAVHAGQIKGMYIMGENPAMSDPDAQHAREGLARLEHLVVQDLFMTETAFHADVILPASAWPEKDGTVTNSNRQVQMGRAALALPGDARQDWWIVQELARRLGYDWGFNGPADVYAEMAAVMPSLNNITWDRLLADSAVTYPCDGPDVPGNDIVFGNGFPTPSGRAKLVPAVILPPDEQPDDEYPLVLTTGRMLEHWHTGAMTRRSQTLDTLEPEAVASISPAVLHRMGLVPGSRLRIQTRRGAIELRARADQAVPEGMIFVPFCYAEAAANMLTNPALDPVGKIPEFKFCAARIEAVQESETESVA